MRNAIGCEDMCGDRLCKYIGCKMNNKQGVKLRLSALALMNIHYEI